MSKFNFLSCKNLSFFFNYFSLYLKFTPIVKKFIVIFNRTFTIIGAFVIIRHESFAHKYDTKNKIKHQFIKISIESVDGSSTTTMITTMVTSDSTNDGSNFRNASAATPESSTSANTNLMALEESFGGTTRAPDPILPTKRRNGLYFLVDWNTFLEVGDEDSEKVNLRFEPKVGDRTRFLPVSVP